MIKGFGGRTVSGGEVQSGFGYLRRQVWTNVAAAANNTVMALTAQPASGTTVVTTGITNPDFPRNITVVGNQATCAGNLVVAGTNIREEAITETLAINGTTPVVGNKAFKTVTSITIPTRGAAGDQVSCGIGVKIGLDRMMAGNEVILATVDGVFETTRPTVAASATAIESNTVLTNTAPDASRDFVVVFVSTEKTLKIGSTS